MRNTLKMPNKSGKGCFCIVGKNKNMQSANV